MAAGTSVGKKAKARRFDLDFDYLLVLPLVGLVTIGLMMVYSATFDWSYQEMGSSFGIASRQFLWVALGLAALVGFALIPYDWWKAAAIPVMVGTLLLLILVLFFGDDVFGARRSFLNGSIQPGELAKLGVIIYVAAWLSSKGDQVRNLTYGLIPYAVLVGIVAGLVMLQPDISTAILIVMIAVAMFFFAGADIFQLSVGGIISAVTLLLLIKQLPHASRRLDQFKFAWIEPRSLDHHIRMALIALGSGGLFGVGLGQSEQKLGYLPAPHTDSIFAVVGEELGFFGCLIVIGLFALLTYRGFRVAMQAPDAFPALLACGVTCSLTFQALLNIAVITGLMPFTGIALPFISSGGSAMVVSLASVGLLLSISRGKTVGKRSKRRAQTRADLDRRWGNRGARLSRSSRHTSTRHR
jgi:cell division protein FtsW